MSVCINVVIISGNIVRDAEVKYLANENACCNFTVAVNKAYKGKDGTKKEKTSFIGCTAWGKLAEIVGQHCKKGDPVLVEGELDQETWERDGNKREKTKVTASNVQFLGGKRQNNEGSEARPAPAATRQEKPVESSAVAKDDPPF